jgi:polyhydroxybutyrate depolymerase
MKRRVDTLFWLLLCVASIAPANAACNAKRLQVGAVERTGIVCAPVAAAKPSSPLPMVLVFHGRGGSAKEMAARTRVHDAWPEALVVYLDGLTGNPGPHDKSGSKRGWQINPGEMQDRDVAFVDAALDALMQRHHVDAGRVYAVGHSNGARLVGILWAMRSDRFTAFAFSAAQADTLIKKAQPRSAFMGMGMHDELVSFAWQKKSIGYAARLLGIAIAPDFDDAGVKRWRGASGLELMTYIHPGPHWWPDGQTQMIVDFFKRQRHPLPGDKYPKSQS